MTMTAEVKLALHLADQLREISESLTTAMDEIGLPKQEDFLSTKIKKRGRK